MVDLVGLQIDTRYFSVLRANIIQQCVHTLAQNVRSHGHGNDAAVTDIGTEGCTDLCFREGLSAEIPLHEFFTGLGYGFY